MNACQRHIINYFDQTHNDYRWLWGIDRHLGLHCGYFDDCHRRHDDAVLHMNGVLATLAGMFRGYAGAGCRLRHRGKCPVARGTPGRSRRRREHECQTSRARPAPGYWLPEHGDHVQFLVADFCATALAGETFDVFWALESACYAEDKSALLAEAYRLLKPGGRLVVADGFLARDDPRHRRAPYRRAARQHGWASPRNGERPSGSPAVLSETGVSRNPLSRHHVSRYLTPRSIYLASLFFYPIGILLYWLSLRTGLQTRGIASGYYQYHARRRGLGVYGIFLAEK